MDSAAADIIERIFESASVDPNAGPVLAELRGAYERDEWNADILVAAVERAIEQAMQRHP